MARTKQPDIVLPESNASFREKERWVMGQILKEKRKALKVGVDIFAVKMLLSRSSLMRLEKGENANTDTLQIVLDGLSLTKVQFFTLVEERLASEKKATQKKPASKKTKSQ